MVIKQIYPNPTVKEVFFQIVFPTLFSMENKIGDIQTRIMGEFPDSSLIRKRNLIIVETGPDADKRDIQSDLHEESGNKIWEFKSKKKIKLNILSNSLGLTSQYHKTYELGGGEKFRDIIKFVLDNFFEVTSIPIIKRIGLRYIDLCPMPSDKNEDFKSYYNSSFPLDKFDLANAKIMEFRTTVKRGDCFLSYRELLRKNDEEYEFILDFDGFAENINSSDYLKTTDKLHKIISDEYEKTIKEPVIKYMKKKED